MVEEKVRVLLSELGVTRCGEVAVADLVFDEAFREACAANRCGKYGTNWACPPGVGDFAALEARVRRFARGLVIQTVWPIEDAFDFDGMLAGEVKHQALFRQVAKRIAPLLSSGATLALGAGACAVCGTCTFPDGKPCRHPDRAMASLESHGIDVAKLIACAGLAYTNGPDTVSYVGMVLF